MNNKNETPSDKFKRIASARTRKILDMIDLLGNCSNRYVYNYSEDDVDKIFNAIETELKVVKEKFKDKDKKKFIL